MSPEPLVILHASTPQGDVRTYRCTDPLELNDALAHEMLRAVDPMTIIRWLEQEDFYHFWTSCLASPGPKHPAATTPGPCHYLDATAGATLIIRLTIEAGCD